MDKSTSVTKKTIKSNKFDDVSLMTYDPNLVQAKREQYDKLRDYINDLESQLRDSLQEDIEIQNNKNAFHGNITKKKLVFDTLTVQKRNLDSRIKFDKLQELEENTTTELLDKSKDLGIKKLESMIKSKQREIKEIGKKGHQTYVYGFFKDKNEEYKKL